MSTLTGFITSSMSPDGLGSVSMVVVDLPKPDCIEMLTAYAELVRSRSLPPNLPPQVKRITAKYSPEVLSLMAATPKQEKEIFGVPMLLGTDRDEAREWENFFLFLHRLDCGVVGLPAWDQTQGQILLNTEQWNWVKVILFRGFQLFPIIRGAPPSTMSYLYSK